MSCSIKKDYNIKLQSKIDDYLTPDYVFIPYNSNVKLKVNNNDYIYKNMHILDYEDKKIFSSVSGKFVGTKKMMVENGKILNCLVIENDFKEKLQRRSGVKKDINAYSVDKVLEIINNYGIYEDKNNVSEILKKHIGEEVLIINTIESEPYIASELFLTSKYIYEILETLDAIMQIFHFKKCMFIIKNNANEIITKSIDYIGTFPNIDLKLVEDIYPIDNYAILKNYLKLKKGCVLKSSTIYEIYLALKRSLSATEKLITISGDGIKNPKVVNAKIGSSIKNIINDLIKIKDEDNLIFIANGLLSGNEIDINSLIVTPLLNGIIIKKKEKIMSTECIKCGQCYFNCPVKINPVLLLNNKKTDISKCLHCGLCSYICPAHINLNKYLEKSEKE